MAENGEVEYDLVMPFVVCQSQGGPYEDEAFVAGWDLGRLDAELEQAAADRRQLLNRTVRTASLPQVDLLAMKHGLMVETEESEGVPEWSTAQFLMLAEGNVRKRGGYPGGTVTTGQQWKPPEDGRG